MLYSDNQQGVRLNQRFVRMTCCGDRKMGSCGPNTRRGVTSGVIPSPICRVLMQGINNVVQSGHGQGLQNMSSVKAWHRSLSISRLLNSAEATATLRIKPRSALFASDRPAW